MSKPQGSKKYTPVMDGLWDWKHVQKMGPAVFLFGELLSRTNKTGKVEVTYPALAEKTGIPIRNLERWMRRLKVEGYVVVSGKNPMSIEIQNFRLIRNGHIPSNMSGLIPSELSGQENSIPTKVAETPQKLSGPNSVTPLKTDTSKPFLKDKKKREKNLSQKSSDLNPKADKKTNPDIKVAVDFFHNEYLRAHGFKPAINGAAGATFKRLLEKDGITINELKELIPEYLSLADDYLTERGYPVELLPKKIDAIRLKKKEPERGFVY